MPTQPIYAMLDTWSSGVTTYNGISMNVTDAASASDSKLINMLISSVSKFTVDKLGNIVAVGGIDLGGDLVVAGTGRFEGVLSADGLELDNDLAVEHGGTGASTAAAARTNLGALAALNGTATGLKLAGGVPFSIMGTGLAYFPSETTHIAYYKKAGDHSFYWRKSDDGQISGPNETTLMQLLDTGELVVSGATVMTTANGGAGTNFDADKVDGLHGTQLLRKDVAGTIQGGASENALSLDSTGNTYLALNKSGVFKGYVQATDALVRVSNNVSSLEVGNTTVTYNGQALWHAGNFNPANYATEANSVGRYNHIVDNLLPGKAAISGASDLEITKAIPRYWLHYPGVKRAAWYLDSLGTLVWGDQGGQNHFFVNGSGRIWCQEFGYVGDQIENRAVAWANDRVANLQTRKTSHTLTLTPTDGDWTTPGGTFMYGYRRGGRVDGFFYAYFQLYDPVYGWRTMSG